MEFNELNTEKDIDEMEPEEAKETLSQFMDAHKENQDAYDELASDLQELDEQYSEEIEEYEARITQFTEDKAQEAAEHVEMPAELLADRFSYDELEQIVSEAEEAEEFSEDEPEDEPEEDDESGKLTTFSDKPERGEAGGDGDRSQYRERAEKITRKLK